jgi:putative transposase
MREENFDIGDYVHVYNRGNRKAKIVRSDKDKWRFMQALRFFNDSHSSLNILRQIIIENPNFKRQPQSIFELGWPKNWPKKDPLVKILCYCLMPNHFHLLLKQIKEDGIIKFMHKLGTGYTNYFNIKHQEVGSVFQGRYKARRVDKDIYLEYLSVYIQVINVLELFPGGSEKALKDINKGLKFVEEYQFSSYRDFVGLQKSLIIDKDILGKLFKTPEKYKRFVRDIIKTKKYELLGDLAIDE